MKKISSFDLINLGFITNFVSAEESGDIDYTFYTLDIDGVTMLISDSSEHDEFTINFFNGPDSIMFIDLDDVSTLVELINKNSK